MITVQFSRGSDFFANAIIWYDHGRWSHVDAVLPDGRLLGARVQGGVAARSADYLGAAPTLRVELPCSEEMAVEFYNAVEAQLGKPYDLTGIAGFVAGRDWQEDDSWFCSELISWALLQCGYFQYPLADRANKITPGDLLLALSTYVLIRQPEFILQPPPEIST